ncbi:Hypothetical predicted protein [Podarcis lilfordi]|uniref:Uncharacterized protein n=1 Tax=Podarcis lilfordi TaxID=74358 RepID=A0AA35KNV6_9SAUR|nr:Hypothetical predicted protein [Podarcis lilfordi]
MACLIGVSCVCDWQCLDQIGCLFFEERSPALRSKRSISCGERNIPRALGALLSGYEGWITPGDEDKEAEQQRSRYLVPPHHGSSVVAKC